VTDLDRYVLERDLIALADGLDSAVDAKDWARVRSFFAERITFAFAGTASEMLADELVGTWRANLFAEKTSLHLRGNHLVEVEGDTATLRSVAYAWNKLPDIEGGDLWEVWGDYVYRYARTERGWKITSFAFSPKHSRGNARIPGYRPEPA
jgi:ketosteroid isomerase-like protein